MNNEQTPAQDARQNGADTHDSGKAAVPAWFTLVRESRDGRLCLFEDADGHYTVVRSARLA